MLLNEIKNESLFISFEQNLLFCTQKFITTQFISPIPNRRQERAQKEAEEQRRLEEQYQREQDAEREQAERLKRSERREV